MIRGACDPDADGIVSGLRRRIVPDLESLDRHVALRVDREQPAKARRYGQARAVEYRVLTRRVTEHDGTVRSVSGHLDVDEFVVDPAADVHERAGWNRGGPMLDGSPGIGIRPGSRVVPVRSHPEYGSGCLTWSAGAPGERPARYQRKGYEGSDDHQASRPSAASAHHMERVFPLLAERLRTRLPEIARSTRDRDPVRHGSRQPTSGRAIFRWRRSACKRRNRLFRSPLPRALPRCPVSRLRAAGT